MRQNHLIIKEILDFTFSEEQEAMSLQNEIRDIVVELEAELSDIFDRIAGPNEYISLDKLEIDVGELDKDNLKEDLKRKITDQVENLLIQKVYRIREGDQEEGEIKSIEQQKVATLVDFMEYGFTSQMEQTPNEILSELIKEEHSSLFALKRIYTDFKWLKRAVKQIKTSLLINLFQFLFDKSIDEAWIKAFVVVNGSRNNDVAWQIMMVQLLPASEFEKSKLEKMAELLELVIFGLNVDLDTGYGMLHEVFYTDSDRIDLLQKLYQKFKDSNKYTRKKDKRTESDVVASKKASEVEEENEDAAYVKKKKQAIQSVGTGQETSIEIKDTIYIGNSGLVLLAAYLKPFFTALKYLEEGAFVSDEMREKAIHLLQFCASEANETPEYDLVLNKILCGLELESTIELSGNLSDFEKGEANDLLQSVADNWEAIGKTSAEGLRQTFLNREGALTLEDGFWLLRVEKITVDVLVEKLPWSIAVIKHPWMEIPLHVEW